jgi:hypothetical protein
VTFRRRSVDVEAVTVVAKDELDGVAVTLDGNPHVGRVGVLERVHHALAGVVIHEQGDRRR